MSITTVVVNEIDRCDTLIRRFENLYWVHRPLLLNLE